jgi:hypothetical protein
MIVSLYSLLEKPSVTQDQTKKKPVIHVDRAGRSIYVDAVGGFFRSFYVEDVLVLRHAWIF